MRTTIEVEYTPELWRKLRVLQVKIHRKLRPNDSGFTAGYKGFGSCDRKARRYCQLISWILRVPSKDGFEVHHPDTGEMRSVTWEPTDYQDCYAGIYVE
jgi:hypothetical protein